MSYNAFLLAIWAIIALEASGSSAFNDTVCVHEDGAIVGGVVRVQRGGTRYLICEGIEPVESFLIQSMISDSVVIQDGRRRCNIFNDTLSCVLSIVIIQGDLKFDGEILNIYTNRRGASASHFQLYASITVLIEDSDCTREPISIPTPPPPPESNRNDFASVVCEGYAFDEGPVNLNESSTFLIEKSAIVKCFVAANSSISFKINGVDVDHTSNDIANLIVVDRDHQYLFLSPHNNLNGSTLQVDGFNGLLHNIYRVQTVITSVNCIEPTHFTIGDSTIGDSIIGDSTTGDSTIGDSTTGDSTNGGVKSILTLNTPFFFFFLLLLSATFIA